MSGPVPTEPRGGGAPGRRPSPLRRGACALAAVLPLLGCVEGGPSLSRTDTKELDLSTVPVPAEDGPRLGALSNVTPVRKLPALDAAIIGYLHAGATVARAPDPFSKEGCPDGWYPVRPRGFVCVGGNASLDLEHPTLKAMALAPDREAPLPWTYARTTKETALYERAAGGEAKVTVAGTLRARSGLAVVGRWQATTPQGESVPLGLLPTGKFVNAEHLAAAEPSQFAGYALGEGRELPVAFVIRQGVSRFTLEKATAKAGKELPFHSVIPLTGKFRTVGGEKFWATAASDEEWVRHRDVNVARERTEYPEFAVDDQKRIDVSIVTGIAIFYEGKRAVYTTLVSVGEGRLADPAEAPATRQGDFHVLAKHLTTTTTDPKRFADGVDLYDVPWAFELTSGQLMHGAYWHDRFGIEHGPGNIQLAPADARWLWQWSEPAVPPGWHGVRDKEPGPGTLIVRVRK